MLYYSQKCPSVVRERLVTALVECPLYQGFDFIDQLSAVMLSIQVPH